MLHIYDDELSDEIVNLFLCQYPSYGNLYNIIAFRDLIKLHAESIRNVNPDLFEEFLKKNGMYKNILMIINLNLPFLEEKLK